MPAERVDSGPARARLMALQRQGIGLRHAARLAGVAFSTVAAIRSGQQRTIRARTSAAILRLTRPYLARGAKVNSYGTRRLLLALRREGYSGRELARRLGCPGRLPSYEAYVTVQTALKVRALFQKLTADL